MPHKIDSISRFSPGNCTHELLESILVGQHELVERLERSVLDSVRTGAGHHWLLIGPRGTGKTHLLAILFNRIAQNRDLRDRIAIAYMKEEERGVATFLDWLVRILRAFERCDERPDPQQDIVLQKELARLTQLPLERAQTEAERLLLRFVGSRKLLLITENLGEIFSQIKGMGRVGQCKFRDLIQQHPFWIIIASTQALFEDIQTRQAPFYGFFKIQHLRMFTFAETIELLEKLASTEGRDQLKKFLRSNAGQGRIRAIHEITRGNPRLLVIFYQFVDRESIEDLAKSFQEWVDNLTAYYQEQMQPLPALQQKIVEFLCERRVPATVKEIAQSCFITHQTASAQLKRLADRRVVQSTPIGRKSYYELREPLFRICFEVKENMGYPIRLFIDFLGRFYTVEELKRKYKSTNLLLSLYSSQQAISQVKKLGTEITYIQNAVASYHREQVEEFKWEYPADKLPDPEDIYTLIEDLFSQEDYREAVRLADAALEYKIEKPELLLKSAVGHSRLGDSQGALEKLKQFIQVNPNDPEAWVEKASIEEDGEDLVAAEESYHHAFELDPTNAEALIGLGRIYGNKGNHAEACTYFLSATQVAPNQANAWRLLGLAQWNQGAHQVALTCFEKATHLQPENAEAWLLLGLAQEHTHNLEGARSSYQKATDLDPNDEDTWLHRSKFEASQGNYETALDYLKKVESLMQPSPAFYNSWGEILHKIGRYEEAIAFYGKAIAFDPGYCFAHFNTALALFQSGDLKAGMEQIARALESGQSHDWTEPLVLCMNDINLHLFMHAPIDQLPDVIERQRQLFAGSPFSASFTEGMIGALTELLKQGRNVSLERLSRLRQSIITDLSKEARFNVVCRLFDTGVRYLEAKDMRILLELPLEERSRLQELLEREDTQPSSPQE